MGDQIYTFCLKSSLASASFFWSHVLVILKSKKNSMITHHNPLLVEVRGNRAQ